MAATELSWTETEAALINQWIGINVLIPNSVDLIN